jgi:hypothetical protein
MKSTIRTLERLIANTQALEEQLATPQRTEQQNKLYSDVVNARTFLQNALENAQKLRR